MSSEIPPAPWHSIVDVLFWVHRATPAARSVLPAQLTSRAGAPLTTGGLLSYRKGPVGPDGGGVAVAGPCRRSSGSSAAPWADPAWSRPAVTGGHCAPRRRPAGAGSPSRCRDAPARVGPMALAG